MIPACAKSSTTKGVVPVRCVQLLTLLALAANSAATPVFVMLPLDTVSVGGKIDEAALIRNLTRVKDAGADGVMVDVWWAIAEPKPAVYAFDPYVTIANVAQELDLKIQVVLSWHSCGGNVGDNCDIPLPAWLGPKESWGYTDREGSVAHDYVSLWHDNSSFASAGDRTPVQMYADFATAFATSLASFIKDGQIASIAIGLGPCGELRYTSYNPKSFPGVGEFQCYDPRALDDLKQAAIDYGQPSWGNGGPDDAGTYRDLSAPFWESGRFDSEYGRFFLGWYSSRLRQHAEIVLSAVRSALGSHVTLLAKIAGIHWQYLVPSHPAEATAGYYNTNDEDAYSKIAKVLAATNAGLSFTCLEMEDNQQPDEAKSSPSSLVAQVREAAFGANVGFDGENALERYDETAYDSILSRARPPPVALDSFTYLRLTSTLLEPSNLGRFSRFVDQMHSLERYN